ncbi:CLUMA_CG005311, isoform A [Clunio marinus]|uniref:CLUMA_CG005311, isoform A n=1 Tax=Clunio marinus TaxID=568069 RepID=A0A1J1HUH5_9DIPT|nr:CLUMA_CG005311, isoform A [Clunio marinus]
MKNILIGGGTGFIGTRLSNLLLGSGYRVTIVSRMPGLNHITWTDLDRNGLPNDTSAVVNLAGQNVLDPTRSWSAGFKQNVWNSRINTTSSIVRAIQSAKEKPEVFVNISGVSNYKPNEKKIYTEDDASEDYDFMSKLCNEWEKAATIDKEAGVRTVKIRTGVVLGREGGMIRSLIIPFWFGFGGPVASGLQPLPWIHITDLCNLIKYSIENKKVEGVLNGVAPQIINNLDFTKSFGKALWRPTLIPLPEFVVNKMFTEERAVLLTSGAKIKPKRTVETGFEYEFPEIYPACKDVGSLFMY